MHSNENEEQQRDSQLKQQSKRLLRNRAIKAGKKIGKAAVKAAAKIMLAAGKTLIGLLAGIGAPFLLVLAGVLLLLFLIYLGTSMIFVNDPDSLDKEQRKLRQHIVELSDNSIDISKREQRPYKVPVELIVSALQIFESEKNDYTPKQAATLMAEALKPVFVYEDKETKLEYQVTTCEEGKCTTDEPYFDVYPMKPLVSVIAWDKKVNVINTDYTTEWASSEVVSHRWEPIEGTGKDGEEIEYKKITTTITTKTRAHTFYDEKIEEMDYSYFDQVLSAPPFDYGPNDKLTVEAIYQATGKDIYYKEWLSGNSLIGFNGTILPGAGVPSEFMQYYLEAEKAYKVDWYYIAAIHFIETGFSTHPTMISSVGAEGHFQFMPCTFVGWSYPGCKGSKGYVNIPDHIKHNPLIIQQYGGLGIDADKNGTASPWEIKDAVFTAASYLSKSGFSTNIDKAIRAYNHSDIYVANVKKKANEFKEAAQYSPESGSIPSLAPGSFMRPSIGSVTSHYGFRWGKLHAGTDIADNSKPPIVAVAGGQVIKSQTGCPAFGSYGSTCGSGWGNHVIVRHTVQGKVYDAVYAHLDRVGVRQNQQVIQGQYLGNMGRSGSSTGIHLHFELHPGGRQGQRTAVNPALYIPF